MTNTEKPTTIIEKKKTGIVETPKPKADLNKAPVQKKKNDKLAEAKASEDKEINKEKQVEQKTSDKNVQKDSSINKSPQSSDSEKAKDKPKKPIQKKPIIKKTEATVNGRNLPLSTKYSIAICKFIKNKRIERAIDELEQVLKQKKAIPMKGELPHRKGKKIMSGKFPKKATEHFIKLLKNLSANANVHGLNKPIIVEAIANIASRPFGRFGRVRKKRTHVTIKVKEKKASTKKTRKKLK